MRDNTYYPNILHEDFNKKLVFWAWSTISRDRVTGYLPLYALVNAPPCPGLPAVYASVALLSARVARGLMNSLGIAAVVGEGGVD